MGTFLFSGLPAGMQTLEQSLAALVSSGQVRMETARSITENAHVLEQRIQAAGHGAPTRATAASRGR